MANNFGSGSAALFGRPVIILVLRIRNLFDPWLRDPRSVIGFFRIPDPTIISESLKGL
jgi:hypothetical protein